MSTPVSQPPTQQHKHTPGPWHWYVRPDYTQGHPVYAIDMPHPTKPGMRYIACLVDGFSAEEMEANARLIAQAPALVEVLQDLVLYAEQDPNQTLIPDGRLRDARAALAAALGQAVQS